MKLYKIIKFFFIYRKNLLKNRKYLSEKYGFRINIFLEFYTTLILVDAPEDLKKKLGKALVETEIKKFIQLVNNDLPKLELNELVNVYDIKYIDNDNWGIAFGYSLANNTILIMSIIATILTVLSISIFLIF